MKKLFALLISGLMTAALLVGCGSTPDAGSTVSGSTTDSTSASEDGFTTSLADIIAKGELVIGLDDTFAPMGFRDPDNKLVGFDIDLGVAVCEELGVEPVFQPISWDAKEIELATGKIDCIWNGMSATPERKESMSLSNEYLNNRIIVMTAAGVTIKDKEDLANYQIGIQASSAALEAVMADDVYASVSENIVEFPTYDEAIMDMKNGRIDCIIVDEVLGNYKNANLDNVFGVADFDFGDDLYAIGFRKSDTELTQAINDALAAVIASGKAEEISIKWFGKNVVI